MSKKGKHAEHENLERWVVSYADFMTLLFAVFTAMYAMASAELASMEDVASAISQSFKEQSIISGIKSIFQGKSAPTDTPNPLSQEKGMGDGVIGNYQSLTYTKGEVESAEKAVKEVAPAIEEVNAEIKQQNQKSLAPDIGDPEGTEETRGVELSVQSRGIKVSFDSRLLFQPGSAILKPESEKQLIQIAERLRPFSGKNLIQVEGHTDNQPIRSALYPSNWELSTARASTVVRALIAKGGFDSKYMAAAGFADSRPIADNTTAEGRAKNRRIDIIIYSRQMTMNSDPQKQHKKEHDLIKSGQPNEPASGKGATHPDEKPKITIPSRLNKQLIETQSSKGDGEGIRVILLKQDAQGNPIDAKVIAPTIGEKLNLSGQKPQAGSSAHGSIEPAKPHQKAEPIKTEHH